MKIAAIIAAALALVPAAFAQQAAAPAPRCAAYQSLIDAQRHAFDPIRGSRIDQWTFRTTFVLPGAGSCSITDDELGDNYICTRDFGPEYGAEGRARAAAAATLAELQSCLPGWRTEADDMDALLDRTRIVPPAATEEEPLILALIGVEEKEGETWSLSLGLMWRRVKPSQLIDASEDGFCASIRGIIDAGADRFASLRGDRIGRTGKIHRAKLYLADDEECVVDAGRSAYRCTRRSDNKRSATNLHEDRSARLQSCLAGWRSEVAPAKTLPGKDQRVAGLRLTGAGADKGAEISLMLDKRELPDNDVAFDVITTFKGRR